MNYLELLFPDFALIVLGYVLCRFTPINRSVWQAVEQLVYYLLFPVLLFHSITRNPIQWGDASQLLAAGVLGGLLGIALTYSLPHLPFLGRRIDARGYAGAAQVAFRFNSFIALALVSRLAGPDGLLYVSVLIGVSVPLFNVAAVWPMTRGSDQHFVGHLLRNPLIIATVSALLFNAAGLKIPALLEAPVARIGAASIALGLMAAGAGLKLSALASNKLLASELLLIRHAIQPLIAFAMVQLFHLNQPQAIALMAFSSLPTASSCYVLAVRMGYEGSFVASLVSLSTMLGVLSLPFGLWLIGI
ncbi:MULTISPECIES: AEC family transporter [Comamonas]|uniref:AEC family transporter n=1 Tax=Comamonas TaxID=283 RepID=UPI0007C48FC0|nr:AEC family transporter [Comamonas thiooxydans]MBL5976673.1 AEC family transporter [Comamonas sp. NyZ500]MCO8247160.1 AEC family transporter [Comamonas thiooxydans]OAD85518.1 transporter [Comamonas thiooxydans]